MIWSQWPPVEELSNSFDSKRFPVWDDPHGTAYAAGRGKSGGGGRSTVGGTSANKGKAKKGTTNKSTGKRGSGMISSNKPGSSARRSATAKVSRRTGRAGAERTGMV
jgi:hypothetical protein